MSKTNIWDLKYFLPVLMSYIFQNVFHSKGGREKYFSFLAHPGPAGASVPIEHFKV
jgi:hypothetical protein